MKRAENNQVRHRHGQAGLTLIEVVTAMGIIAVAGTLLVRLYIVTYKGIDAQHAKLEQMSTVRSVLWSLKRDLRAASAVVPAYRTYESGERTLVLEVPALDAQGRARADRRDRVVYESTPTGVTRLVVPDAESTRPAARQTLTDKATTLTFAYDGTDLRDCALVTVHIEDKRRSDRRETALPASLTVRLRNHP
jgi:type II secretory pathway pseudopilin PulG